jgi:hypothetical protein
MPAILAPTVCRRVLNQRPDEPECLLPDLGIFLFEDNAHDMMHFAHTDHEGADEIEAGFRAASFLDFVLQHAVVAADFGDGREEEVEPLGSQSTRFSSSTLGML